MHTTLWMILIGPAAGRKEHPWQRTGLSDRKKLVDEAAARSAVSEVVD
jgi:hypothetical protein